MAQHARIVEKGSNFWPPLKEILPHRTTLSLRHWIRGRQGLREGGSGVQRTRA